MIDEELKEWQNQDSEDYQCYLEYCDEWYEITEEINEF